MQSSRTRGIRPWWATGSELRCGFCAQPVAADVAYRCVGCDAPVCPGCAVILRERREVYCPSCPADHGGD